jgi:hypothetical protein
MFLRELGTKPFGTLQHLAQVVHCVPDIFKPDVKRGQPKTKNVFVKATVPGAEITNHTSRDQRLNNGERTLISRQADL